jgi:hypothetical protein
MPRPRFVLRPFPPPIRHRLIASGLAGGLAVVLAGALTLWTVGTATAASTAYEAEAATLSGGAVVATDHSGYSGSGFVGGYTDGNKGAAASTFAVTANPGGGYTLSLRYANGTTATKTLSLYVNGAKVRQISLPATANWDTWGTETETVTLSAGAVAIAYRFDSTDSGNVNLDRLTVTTVSAPPAGTYEAESAALSGGAVVATDHSGYTGSGFVGGFTDANKGNAATAFTVSAGGAGLYTSSLRYANGTGASMTLSVYVNGAKIRQTSLPATANWDTWGTVADAVTLNAGTNTVTYRFDSTDSGNVNLDSITLSGPATPPPPTPSNGYELEGGFVSGGPSVATAVAGWAGTGYITGFTTAGARVITTVNTSAAGAATITLRYNNSSGTSRTLSDYANGLKVGQLSLPAGSGWLTVSQTLTLRAGLNTIGFQYDSGDSGGVSVDQVVVSTGIPRATRGATTGYVEYEAEAATTNATTLGPDRTYLTVASEASGRRAVRLSSTGQYVRFTLTQPTNSLVIRYSIPDSADGAGQSAPIAVYVGSTVAGATKVKDVTLTSTYSWVYGAYPYTNVPSQGSAHHFFDEVRTTFATTYPAGTVLALQKDASSTAARYDIDLVDTEQVAPALAMPANFLSVTGYGATANDGTDDTAALASAVSAAQSQGKGVWVPAGQFIINAHVNLSNVAIRGAGMWYSVIRGTNGKGGLFATGGGVQVVDLTIAGDVRYRDDTNFDTGLEGNFGAGSLVQNVWIEHTKVGAWINSGTNGLYVVGLRIRDTMADGVNIHANVVNARVDQTAVRNTGDDALAMFSEGAAVTNSAYTFVTVQVPLLANAVGIYGGNGNRIEDSLLSDTVTASAGIAISTRFGPVGFSGTTRVARNTLTRTGGYENNWGAQLGALWIYADTADITAPVQVQDLSIMDSTYQGILLSYQRTISNLTVDHVTVSGAGTYGIELNCAGNATFSNVAVTGAASGGLHNMTGYTLIRGAGNSGF